MTRGSCNAFAEVGFPDAAERQAKLRLAYALNQVLKRASSRQADAAKVWSHAAEGVCASS